MKSFVAENYRKYCRIDSDVSGELGSSEMTSSFALGQTWIGPRFLTSEWFVNLVCGVRDTVSEQFCRMKKNAIAAGSIRCVVESWIQ